MALFDHDVRNDRLEEQHANATELGTRKIPTMMTIPLAQLKMALRDAKEAFDDATQMLQDQYTDGEWKEVDDPKRPDQKIRKLFPTPVYARNEDGSPKFKLDAKGNPTAEREILHGRVQLTNSVEHGRELRLIQRQTTRIRVPHLSWLQLEGKAPMLEANVTAALFEYFDGIPTEPNKAEPAASGKKSAGRKTESAAAT